MILLALIPAIVLHELAHGWVAENYCDYTARDAGRMSFNPLRHVDPIGTLLMPALTYALAGFTLGWAKPVPVNFQMLTAIECRHVVLAGPFCNLLQALFWALVGWPAAVKLNLLIAAVNMIPIPPLDGGRALAFSLEATGRRRLAAIEPYGMGITVLLIALIDSLI